MSSLRAKRSNLTKENFFTPFHLEDLYNKFENQYKYNFSSACMPILSLEDIFNPSELTQITNLITSSKLDYTAELGTAELREALIENLYPNLNKDQFIASAGAAEAIHLVMKSLFSKGDKIIVQKPIYQSLFQIAEDSGVEVVEWQFDFETNSWDLNQLDQLIKNNLDFKALVINNPNNPTGIAFTQKELEEIISKLEGRIFISDEVFQALSLNETPSIASLYDNAVSISDLSKSFSLPGLRLGWIACQNPSFIKRFSAMHNYLSLRTSSISDMLATQVLTKSETIIQRNKEILKNNIENLFKLNKEDLFFELKLNKEQISGLCIFPKLKEPYQKINCEKLIQDQSILLATGENFGKAYIGYCRIGLGNMPDFQILDPML